MLKGSIAMKAYYFFEEEQNMPEEAQQEKPAPKTVHKGRIHLIDELRGFALLFMVCYHTFYTVGYFFDWQWGRDIIHILYPIGPYFAGIFIVISGIASNLSHSNIDRGARLFFIAYIVTLVSFFAVGEQSAIRFGILHMLSICMMLYGLLSRILKVIPLWIGFSLNVILFVLTLPVTTGSIEIPFLWEMKLPSEWYMTDFLYPLGFINSEFTSGDFFPLLPWLFLFFAGTFFGRLAVNKKLPKFTYRSHVKPLAFIGRYSLLIYLLHQPVIFGVCTLVQMLLNMK